MLVVFLSTIESLHWELAEMKKGMGKYHQGHPLSSTLLVVYTEVRGGREE
jgi:hypothetical protein